jgi:hypothetical protein
MAGAGLAGTRPPNEPTRPGGRCGSHPRRAGRHRRPRPPWACPRMNTSTGRQPSGPWTGNASVRPFRPWHNGRVARSRNSYAAAASPTTLTEQSLLFPDPATALATWTPTAPVTGARPSGQRRSSSSHSGWHTPASTAGNGQPRACHKPGGISTRSTTGQFLTTASRPSSCEVLPEISRWAGTGAPTRCRR